MVHIRLAIMHTSCMLSGLDIEPSSSNSKPLVALVASPRPVAKAVRPRAARSKSVNGGSKTHARVISSMVDTDSCKTSKGLGPNLSRCQTGFKQYKIGAALVDFLETFCFHEVPGNAKVWSLGC